MKTRLLLTLSVTLLLFAACKKGGDTLTVKKHLLTQLITSGSMPDTVFYKYDTQGHLIEQYGFHGTYTTKTDTKYIYDGSDRLIEKDYTVGPNFLQKEVYDYSVPGKVTDVIGASNPNVANYTYFDTVTFTVNNSLQPIKRTQSSNVGSYLLYTYDGNGNMTAKTSYSTINSTQIPESATFTFDKNKSCFSDVKGNLYFALLTVYANNMLTEIQTASGGEVLTTNSVFTYNSDGYPATEIRIQTSNLHGVVSTLNYTYVYATL